MYVFLPTVGKFKMQVIAVLLMVSFVLCNGIPDMMFIFEHDKWMYDFVSIIWSLGYLVDPIIYIFTAAEMRKIAARKILCMLIIVICY